MWSANKSIHDEIIKCRNDGRKVIHRISISTFELEIFGLNLDKDGNVEQPSSKDKPFETYKKISEDPEIKKSIGKILNELSNVGSNEFPFNEKDANYLPQIFKKWVKENGIKDIRYLID